MFSCIRKADESSEWDSIRAIDEPVPILAAALEAFPKRRLERYSTWMNWMAQMVATHRPPKEARDLLPPEREVVSMPGGGCAAIDWIGGAWTSTTPPTSIVFGMPGIGASSTSGFMSCCSAGMAVGIPGVRVAVMVPQGLDGLPLESRCVMSTAYMCMDDPGHLLSHIAAKYPGVPIVGFSNSLSSGHFVRWAGANPEWCKKVNLKAAVCLCFGYSVATTSQCGDDTIGVPSFVLGAWRAAAEANMKQLQELETRVPGFSVQRLLAATTIGDWEAATCPLYGFADREEMLGGIETNELAHKMTLPTVFIGSDDDPLTPATRLLKNEVHLGAAAAVICTHGGGHMCWWEGWPGQMDQSWIFQVCRDAVAALFKAAGTGDPTSHNSQI